ncbi:hypothetical protein [Streptomyces sp. NPDC001292]|uniref:hypothetical protein n=1 Tax=Streptomyces sp. NPDC001292 TaxID=3364558 RepID=UPI0036A0D85B
MIARARDMLTRAEIGREAFVLSDSFLCAGEGFAHFKSGRADAAVSSILKAMDRCRELRDAWDYPVEGRRIHLACNAARVHVEAGKHKESSAVLAQLLNLIDTSDRRFWPFPDLEYLSKPDRLEGDIRRHLMDQVLAVVSRLDAEALSHVAAVFSYPPRGVSNGAAARARCFVKAVRAHTSGDFETFLACCIEFFPPGAQHFPRSFRTLTERLTHLCEVRPDLNG